jgi:hypothetical protein
MNRLANYVASRTLREPAWSNTTLLRHDLVDAYRLWVFPLLLGTGKRLFAEGTVPIGLRLVETSTSATGVVLHTYQRASRLDAGSMAPQPPPAAAQR